MPTFTGSPQSLSDTALYDNIVVGSGPSGYVAARTLAEHGEQVLVLDLGGKPPKELLEIARSASIERNPRAVDVPNTHHSFPSRGPSPTRVKTFWGNDSFTYRRASGGEEPNGMMSRARGGFSWVWGATWLPFSNSELSLFPPEYRERYLKAWEEVSSWVDSRYEIDALSKVYANPSSGWIDQSRSTQYPGHFISNAKHGYSAAAGSARVAVRRPTWDLDPTKGCIRCGNCQLGCPFGHIWNSAISMVEIAKKGSVRVETAEVISFKTREGVVTLDARVGRQQLSIQGKRLFLCAGPVGSADLLLQSMSPAPAALEFSDSRTSLIAGFRFRKPDPNFDDYSLPSLQSHFFFGKKKYGGACQVYDLSENTWIRVESQFPLLNGSPKWLKEFLRRVTFIGLMYADESRSGRIIVTKAQPGSPKLDLEETGNVRASSISDLFQHARTLFGFGLIPMFFKNLRPGEGNHFGTLKMSNDASLQKTRELLANLERNQVWICDASSLPRIPNGPITASVMAHSRLVVRQALELEKDR